jgi:hypothetical protein
MHYLPAASAPALLVRGFEVAGDVAELRKFDIAELHITIPSPLARGQWLRDLIAAAPHATVVSYQPGHDDRASLLESGLPAARLVTSMVGFIAYSGPLEGEKLSEPGLAYWFPPMSPSLYSGPPGVVDVVVERLRMGQFKAQLHPNVPAAGAIPSSMLPAYLTALECAGWSLDKLLAGEHLVTCGAAAREAIAIATPPGESPPYLAMLLTQPAVFRAALWGAQKLMPFPLEPYLKKHFSKVLSQTRAMVSSMIARGERDGKSVTVLRELSAQAIVPEPAYNSTRLPESS